MNELYGSPANIPATLSCQRVFSASEKQIVRLERFFYVNARVISIYCRDFYCFSRDSINEKNDSGLHYRR